MGVMTTSSGPRPAVRYSGSFTLDSWEQDDDAPDGALSTSRVLATKTFSGDVTGTSRTRLILAAAGPGTLSYAGFEHLTATVAGRSGTLALRHAAEAGTSGSWLTWTVLPGSGTGGLAGAGGEGQIERHDDGTHTFWLDLALD